MSQPTTPKTSTKKKSVTIIAPNSDSYDKIPTIPSENNINIGESESSKNFHKDVVMAASEVDQKDQPIEVVQNKAAGQKIMFKKAKKLHKKASSLYFKHMADTKAGKFDAWTKYELVTLLISMNIELRNEEKLDVIALKDLAESLYHGKPAPNKPAPFSLFDVVFQNVMARRIQNFWISYSVEKRHREEEAKSLEYIRKMQQLENNADGEIGAAELMYMGMDRQEVIGGALEDIAQSVKFGTLPTDEKEDEKQDLTPDGHRKLTRRLSRKILNVLDVPWEPPEIEKAQKYADYVQPRKGGLGGKYFDFFKTTTGRHCFLGGLGEQFDLWEEGQVSEFSIYGPGVTNYFKFLKWGFWLFVILTIIALPSLVLNVSGPNNANSGLKSIARTTIGNLDSYTANTTISVRIPGCNDYGIYDVNCYLGEKSISLFYAILDIIVITSVLLGFLWLYFFERSEEQELDQNTIRPSMYTIAVSNIPGDINEEELTKHIDNILRVTLKEKKDEEIRQLKAKKKSYSNLLKDDYRSSIVSITFAYDNIEEINEAKARGDLIRAKVHLVHEHRYTVTQLRKKYRDIKTHEEIDAMVESERVTFFDKMKKLNVSLKEKEEKLEELSRVPLNTVSAFITFDKVVDCDRVLELYNNMSLYQWLFRSAHLKIHGKFPIVKQAPDPSIIIWENLAYPFRDRMKRRIVSFFLSLVLVVITLIMIFSSKYLEQTASNNGNTSSDLCPSNFYDWSEADQLQYVEDNSSELYCYCDQFNTFEQARNSHCSNYLRRNIYSQVLIYFASFIVLVINNLIERVIRFASNYERHHTQDGKGMSIFIRVFILKYINTAAVFLINNNNVILRRVFGLHVGGSTTEFNAQWFNSVGVTIVLVQLGDIVNAHSGRILQYLMYFFRTRRLVEFFTTNYGTSSDSSKKLHGDSSKKADSIRGSSTKPPPATTTPATTTTTSSKKETKQAKDLKILTQDELNKKFVGPDFEFAFNYAQLMSTFFVCLTFSTGIPLLYPIAAANFLLFYNMEKYLFVRLYKIPPHFNTLIGKRATSLVPFALLIHVIMSVWVLSNNSLFNSESNFDTNSNYVPASVFGDTIQHKITSRATFPLFVYFIVLLVLCFSFYFLGFLTPKLAKLYHYIFGCVSKSHREQQMNQKLAKTAKSVVTYTRAVQRKLIKGLVNYNILQNPMYKEAFGITWKFAVAHKDVRAVRTLKGKAQTGADEDDAAKVDMLQRKTIVDKPTISKTPKKIIGKNRSFYGSFYQKPGEENIHRVPNEYSVDDSSKKAGSPRARHHAGHQVDPVVAPSQGSSHVAVQRRVGDSATLGAYSGGSGRNVQVDADGFQRHDFLLHK